MRVHDFAWKRILAAVSLFVITVSASMSASERITLEDRVARDRFEFLAARSATMKQMLAVIEMTPGVLVRVRALHGLRDSMRAGHGKLEIDANGIRAVLEFDTIQTRPLQQLEIVAHEIAHVIEVACLPPTPASGDLQGALLRRGFGVRQRHWDRIAIETPFAVAVGRRVTLEALKGGTHPGQLHKLAGQHNLRPPCTATAPPLSTTASSPPE